MTAPGRQSVGCLGQLDDINAPTADDPAVPKQKVLVRILLGGVWASQVSKPAAGGNDFADYAAFGSAPVATPVAAAP